MAYLTRLIHEARKWPCLNEDIEASSSYDVREKRDAWNIVCSKIFSNWNIQTKEEKNKNGREVQLTWITFQDTHKMLNDEINKFVRGYREVKNTQSSKDPLKMSKRETQLLKMNGQLSRNNNNSTNIFQNAKKTPTDKENKYKSNKNIKNLTGPLKTSDVLLSLYNKFSEESKLSLQTDMIKMMEDRLRMTSDKPHQIHMTNSSILDSSTNFEDCDSDLSEESAKNEFEIDENVHRKSLNINNSLCPICKQDFDTHETMLNHYRVHLEEFHCEECGKQFMDERTLKRHRSRFHKAKEFDCELCDKKFFGGFGLRQHVKRVHQRENIYGCTQCSERFKNYYERKRHIDVAHGIAHPAIGCKTCNKTFNTTSNLANHMKRFHFRIKNYKCEQCGKSFDKSDDLRGHMTSHTGVKDFKCEHCGRQFAKKKTLVEHLKIHADLRNYVCEKCGKAYNQNISLQAHMKSHETATSVACELNQRKSQTTIAPNLFGPRQSMQYSLALLANQAAATSNTISTQFHSDTCAPTSSSALLLQHASASSVHTLNSFITDNNTVTPTCPASSPCIPPGPSAPNIHFPWSNTETL